MTLATRTSIALLILWPLVDEVILIKIWIREFWPLTQSSVTLSFLWFFKVFDYNVVLEDFRVEFPFTRWRSGSNGTHLVRDLSHSTPVNRSTIHSYNMLFLASLIIIVINSFSTAALIFLFIDRAQNFLWPLNHVVDFCLIYNVKLGIIQGAKSFYISRVKMLLARVFFWMLRYIFSDISLIIFFRLVRIIILKWRVTLEVLRWRLTHLLSLCHFLLFCCWYLLFLRCLLWRRCLSLPIDYIILISFVRCMMHRPLWWLFRLGVTYWNFFFACAVFIIVTTCPILFIICLIAICFLVINRSSFVSLI